MDCAPRPTTTTGPRATASSTTRVVTSTSRSSLGGSLASVIGEIHSCELSAMALASRSTMEGSRSSRDATSAGVAPMRSATASTTALSSSDQPRSSATRRATSEPPEPYIREIVMIGMLVAVSRRQPVDPQLFDGSEAERAPRGARNVVFRRNVQTDLAQPARSAPADTFVEESLQDTGSSLARGDIRRRHVAIALGEEQRRARRVHAAENPHRFAVALSQQN